MLLPGVSRTVSQVAGVGELGGGGGGDVQAEPESQQPRLPALTCSPVQPSSEALENAPVFVQPVGGRWE